MPQMRHKTVVTGRCAKTTTLQVLVADGVVLTQATDKSGITNASKDSRGQMSKLCQKTNAVSRFAKSRQQEAVGQTQPRFKPESISADLELSHLASEISEAVHLVVIGITVGRDFCHRLRCQA